MQKAAQDLGQVPLILKLARFAPETASTQGAMRYAQSVGASGVKDLTDDQLVEFARRMGLNQESIELAMPSASVMQGGSRTPNPYRRPPGPMAPAVDQFAPTAMAGGTVANAGTMAGGGTVAATPAAKAAPSVPAKGKFFQNLRSAVTKTPLRKGLLIGGGALALGGAAAAAGHALGRRRPQQPQMQPAFAGA